MISPCSKKKKKKNHRSYLTSCRVQRFKFQEKDRLPRSSCWSHDLCSRVWKWLISPSDWRINISPVLFHHLCSIKRVWHDGQHARWQMMPSDGPQSFTWNQINGVSLCCAFQPKTNGEHENDFMWTYSSIKSKIPLNVYMLVLQQLYWSLSLIYFSPFICKTLKKMF